MTDREIAYFLLVEKCGKCLSHKNLYPEDIFYIAYDFINKGCKSRGDYVYLVNFFIDNEDFRKELLK